MGDIRCPGCRSNMHEGFMLDRFGEYRKESLFWVSGTRRPYLLGQQRVLPVSSWRCPSCGLVSTFALDDQQQNGRGIRSADVPRQTVFRELASDDREVAAV